jgi:tripartite-type tricarboxylate transporter receptor subunit TctC
MAEQGFKMQPIDGRYGFVVPAATPREVVNRINAASVAALKMPDVRTRFETQLGYAIVGDTPDDYQRAIRNDSETFGNVIRRAGIKAE